MVSQTNRTGGLAPSRQSPCKFFPNDLSSRALAVLVRRALARQSRAEAPVSGALEPWAAPQGGRLAGLYKQTKYLAGAGRGEKSPARTARHRRNQQFRELSFDAPWTPRRAFQETSKMA